MDEQNSPDQLRMEDLLIASVSVFALVLLLPTQFIWIVIFDEMRWDSPSNEILFLYLLPAVTVSAIPFVVGRQVYDRRTTMVLTGLVFALSAVVSHFIRSVWRIG